ncbi:uncharacterized protein LOC111880256 [Lactuca sativa]|uniref:uncharacterized protein LOC111880256 n=1 Tax=Lactuca sativa TaxID=4236 RepID=UPI000CBAFF2F|nr:uncharacterized protein LOC111880256 [Lactuca sativa]XP_052626119.1 uncharacterized protein LOC111880256 [Lactuca sativa]
MEEEMITLQNIMPVDLAIKRELEYRKKMEISRNQHQNNLKPLVASQVRGLEGQRMVDRKRKVQPSNARFICVVCDMAFASVFHLKMHGETYAHRSNLCMARNGGENVSNPFLCEVCDILCSSGKVMKLHAAGVKHKGYLQEFEDARRARFYGNFGSYQ